MLPEFQLGMDAAAHSNLLALFEHARVTKIDPIGYMEANTVSLCRILPFLVAFWCLQQVISKKEGLRHSSPVTNETQAKIHV